MAGRKGEKFWADAVSRAINRRLDDVEGKPKKIEALADRLVEAGLAGDITALKEIGDRIDGKPSQAISHANDPDQPLFRDQNEYTDEYLAAIIAAGGALAIATEKGKDKLN